MEEVGNVVEFFSGIGGWSFAFKCSYSRGSISKLPAESTAIEINVNSNKVYKQNFPTHKLICKDITHIKLDKFKSFKANTWVLSPPCQPYTTLGKQLDSKDNRSSALHHICDVIIELPVEKRPKYICLENVPGFYKSISHEKLIETLKECGYFFHQFLLSPTQFGIPNERIRYFCVARTFDWKFKSENDIHNEIPGLVMNPRVDIIDDLFSSNDYLNANSEHSCKYFSHCKPLSEFLEISTWGDDIIIPDSFTKKCQGYKHDLLSPKCSRSSCFTSGYTSNARGAGSLLFLDAEKFLPESRKLLPKISPEIIKEGKIRFFTPREVANLMGFPNEFLISDEISLKAKYKLLGNSINVECASRVLDFLFSE